MYYKTLEYILCWYAVQDFTVPAVPGDAKESNPFVRHPIFVRSPEDRGETARVSPAPPAARRPPESGFTGETLRRIAYHQTYRITLLAFSLHRVHRPPQAQGPTRQGQLEGPHRVVGPGSYLT